MKKLRSFTLMELIVVMSVIIVLGGVLLPQVNRVITESRTSKAKAELEHIKAAMLAYKKDTGELPPKAATFTEASITAAIINALLATDSASGWDGPYLDKSVLTDPWGEDYIYADNDGVTSRPISYLLSKGPDETKDVLNPHLTTASGVDDDIYVVVYNDGD
ncbi:MAG: type II secretion system protein GspG [Candidatus Kaelpia aquatica]|nr:type II secretion system protein GspG [Candidatus Kaelpia aquatica]